jgi:3-isopropylmalate/(R)-2-methylmalate dehydratase small subunit
MAPGYSEHRGLSTKEEALFCMHSNRPDWSTQVEEGDIIIGGKNFGCGSSRMQAPLNLKVLGIKGIVAETFGRIFFRNCISQGILVLACQGIMTQVQEGQTLQMNAETGCIVNLTTGTQMWTNPLPNIALEILRAGGIIPLLKKEYSH